MKDRRASGKAPPWRAPAFGMRYFSVMAGLVPAIHVLATKQGVDARDKRGHDGARLCLTSIDIGAGNGLSGDDQSDLQRQQVQAGAVLPQRLDHADVDGAGEIRADVAERAGAGHAVRPARARSDVSFAGWRGPIPAAPKHRSHHELEPFTWCAAVAGATRYPAIIATFHAQLTTPAFVAKAATTIDQISGGRAGLNVVAGSSKTAFNQFGLEIEDH